MTVQASLVTPGLNRQQSVAARQETVTCWQNQMEESFWKERLTLNWQPTTKLEKNLSSSLAGLLPVKGFGLSSAVTIV